MDSLTNKRHQWPICYYLLLANASFGVFHLDAGEMDQLKNFLSSLRPNYDDDTIDRLNNYYTIFVLIVFSITLRCEMEEGSEGSVVDRSNTYCGCFSAKQYVGEPLQCWVPAQFHGKFIGLRLHFFFELPF